jgi:membrane protease YdiL (CAAX protease family)
MSKVTVDLAIAPDSGQPAIGVCMARQPWGFWATLAWGVIGIALAREGPYALPYGIEYGVRFWNWIEPSQAFAWHRGVWWQLAVSSLTGFFLIGASVIAARASGYPVKQYLGLVRPSKRDLILGLAILFALLVAATAAVTWYVFVTPSGSTASHSLFANGTTATLLWIWPAGVVIAPVSEELMFRGFLFRGWEKTWLGAGGTIMLTAASWALLHTNKNWLGVVITFVAGLLLGWMRQRSGSTILTILLHGTNNLVMAVLVTMVAIASNS